MRKNNGIKRTLLLIENMELDIKYILIDELIKGTLRTESVKERAFTYIKSKCSLLPISVRNMTCNVVYRSYYRWLDIMLGMNGETFENDFIKLLNTDYMCVYDINGENVSLRKQIENVLTWDKKVESNEVLKQHYLERKLRNANKKYLLCLKFGEKVETIDKLAYKYYNYIRSKEIEYNKYCLENHLRRSNWRCKILVKDSK